METVTVKVSIQVLTIKPPTPPPPKIPSKNEDIDFFRYLQKLNTTIEKKMRH